MRLRCRYAVSGTDLALGYGVGQSAAMHLPPRDHGRYAHPRVFHQVCAGYGEALQACLGMIKYIPRKPRTASTST
eukprot:2600750-Rhodomonas_salina.1